MKKKIATVLKSHVGYKFKMSFPRVDISSTHKDYQCQGNLYLIFWRPDLAPESFVAEDEYWELEDLPDIIEEDKHDDQNWYNFRDGDMVYSITCSKVEISTASFQSVRLANDFHEITEVHVYKRKMNNARLSNEGDALKYSSPELYIIEFKTGNKIIIYYNESGPYKSIFYSEQDLLNSLYEWKRLSLNDFDIVA